MPTRETEPARADDTPSFPFRRGQARDLKLVPRRHPGRTPPRAGSAAATVEARGHRFASPRRVTLFFQLAWLAVALAAPPLRAADKNGVAPSAISLPKGPGSVEGLGESFQPSLNTGLAKHAIELQLPPGTAGHQPGLRLAYEGGGGNGPLGYGWNLPLPAIQRRSDKGIPTYGADPGFPRADVFINEMKEELVPSPEGFFFCKNEGAFIRYRQLVDHWEAHLPNGTKLEFGRTASARIEDATTGRQFCWLLERETDTHGNVIEYSYRSFPGPLNLNQKYLAAVRYGPGGPPWTHFHFVAFDYEDRPDWFEDARAGFLVRTGKRLRTILVGTQGVTLPGHAAGDFDGDGVTDALDRRYDLAYARYAGAHSHWSLLETVTQVGADGLAALPPARFSYAVSNPPDLLSAQGHIWGAVNTPLAGLDNSLVELADLNADGLPDLLKTDAGGGAHTVALNRGPTQADNSPAVAWADPVAVDPGNGNAWSFDLASDATHLADMDGDGLADLVHKSADGAVFYFPNRGNVAWGERQEMALQEEAPPAPFGRPDVRTADLDFDKRIDVIQSLDAGGAVFRIWFNLGAQHYSPPITVESPGGFDFALPGVLLADCNGDRVPDLARLQPGAVQVAAGLGYGRFAQPLSLVLPDFILDDSQIAKARLIDINGDGLADLVLERAAPGVCWYWLNLGNYTLSSRKMIVDLPADLSAGAAVRWADLNGNATIDLVYSDSQRTPQLQFVDLGEILGGGLPPNLLTQIENGLGAVTRITYAPSTRFASEDAAAGAPWPDTFPFPVTVVAGVTRSDSLGHEYRSSYRYHDGFYDPAERQFRGFARVEQIDLGDTSAPTLVTRSTFDTGREFEAMKGRLLRLTVEQEEGRIFSDETKTYANPPRLLVVGTNGVMVRFAHPVAATKDVLELGQGQPARIESTFDYDAYGNEIRATNYGIVQGTNRAAFDDERVTITEFALNLGAWILRAPSRQLTGDENGVLVARSEWFYDDETFSGNNAGSVTVGNLTLRRDWVTPSNATAYIQAVRHRYDAYGNIVAILDPLADGGDPSAGHSEGLTYDEGFHAYPIREMFHVGGGKADLVLEAAYDEGLATARSSVEFNGHETTYGYDALGRLIQVVKPGDTPDYPTTEYEYALAVPVGTNGLVNYVETRALDQDPGRPGSKRDHYFISRRFVDGLGRDLMTKGEEAPAPGGSSPRVTVQNAVLFNARQTSARVLNPFYSLQGESLDALLAYENVEAPGWQGAFHQDGQTRLLGLAEAHQTAQFYDATLRPMQTINPDGSSTRTVYEPFVTRSFDENDTDPASPHAGTPKVQTVDGLGRLIRLDELVRWQDDGRPSGTLNTWTTRYEYDLNDRLTRIVDAQGNVKTFAYDGLKRKIFMNDPDRGSMSCLYDDASNVLETRDAKNQRITFTYDGANRLLTQDYHDESSPEFSYHRSPDVACFYDEPAGPVDNGDGTASVARNTRGALAYVIDTSGEEHNSYDARGRVERIVKRIPDPTAASVLTASPSAPLVSYATRYTYDSFDRLVRLIYPDRDEITFDYDERGQLHRIHGGPGGAIISSIERLPSGQPAGIVSGNGVRTTYAYDSRLRLRHLLTSQPAPGAELIHFAYTLDGVSNLRTIEDQRPDTAIPPSDPRRNTQLFAYDDLYRLTRVQYNPSSPSTANQGAIHYRYDRIGNLLEQTSDIAQLEHGVSLTDPGAMTYGGAAGPANRSGRQPNDPPGPHALTSIARPAEPERPLRYDANGNVTQFDGLVCTWDFDNRLVAVENDQMRAEYTYDHAGRRVTKRVVPKAPGGEVSTTVYVSKDFEIREHDQPTKYVFNGGTRVARITGTLSTDTRVQRFRIRPGWNLLSLAIRASAAAQQLSGSPSASVDARSIVRWNSQTLGWSPVTLDETLDAGTVLWLRASNHAILALAGTYQEPSNPVIPAGGSFRASAGFDVVPLLGDEAALGAEMGMAHFDAARQGWQIQLPWLTSNDKSLPRYLSPGHAVFIEAPAPSLLQTPDPALRVRFYHQDHLGSSSVMTDANGALVEETAYHPFGLARHEHRLSSIAESYQFTQKERDRESGFHYFESRFLTASASRFLSVDPKYVNPDTLSGETLKAFLSQPQQLNLYAYVLNNPLRYSDPTGLGPWGWFRDNVWIPGVDDWDEFDGVRTAKVVGGAVEAVGGALSCGPTIGAGCAAMIHGSDVFTSGVLDRPTLTSQAVEKVTGSATAGQYADFVIGTALGAATIKGNLPAPGSIKPSLTPPKVQWSPNSSVPGFSGRQTLPGVQPWTQAVEGSAEGPVFKMTKAQWIGAQERAANWTRNAVQMRGGNAYKEVCEPIAKQADEIFGPDELP